jgi:asparagine synthase (glutamine-hydrolysing)
MCGIVGTVKYRDKEILHKMNEIQVHRGPDSEGIFWSEELLVGLAMRRLSIVDLENGTQPMYNENKRCALVFNGEIFNADILRKELLEKGHTFVTVSSDTEVLVHLYEEYGTDMLNYLNGMFAFAICDLDKKQIFVARDQMGIKPLHYIFDGSKLAFASEMKSLTGVGLSQKKIDENALWQYLSFQCVPAPMTIYEDIKILPAAHYMLFDMETAELKIEKYWDCIENRKKYEGSAEELSLFVRKQVEEAVERWTMSDVPLACSLSGGLDSTIIATIVSRKRELHTYSLGFENESEFDERGLAKLVAQKCGTRHTEIVLTPDELLKDFGKMIKSMDTPYGGGVPSWFVFREISGNEKVAFNGTGGDELFGNYSKWLRYEHPLERYKQTKHFLQIGEKKTEFVLHPNGTIYHKYMTEGMKSRVVNKPYHGIINTNTWIEKTWRECPSGRWRDRIPYVDFKIQLPEEFLMMLDRFSMNFSVEARVPFLDRELVENILGIPAQLRTKKYNAKYLLKEAFGDMLPKELLSFPKSGFAIPQNAWLKNELKEMVVDMCTGTTIKQQGLFSADLEKQLIRPFYNGRNDLTLLVWTVLMFQRWYFNQ